jgi:hypothetical protein
MKTEDDKCGNCIYFTEIDNQLDECRLNPPVVLIVSNTARSIKVITIWPEVDRDDWCGKHESVYKK